MPPRIIATVPSLTSSWNAGLRLPEALTSAIKLACIEAGREFSKSVGTEPSREQLAKAREIWFWRVFLAYGSRAHELVRQGTWKARRMVTSGEDFFRVAAEAADIKWVRLEVDAELRGSPEWGEYEVYLSAALKAESTRLEAADGAGNIQAKAARPSERAWTLTGSDQAGHEEFEHLARRVLAELGHRVSGPDEAVDNWLELVFEHLGVGRLHGADDWCLEEIGEKSARYCAELAVRFLEANQPDKEARFSQLKVEFCQLPKELHAIRRTDTRPRPIAIRAMSPKRRGRKPRCRVNGGRLKEYRRRCKMNQQELAEKLEVDPSTIQRGESGQAWEEDTFIWAAQVFTGLLNERVTPEDLKLPQKLQK